jgi:MFS superfamily sulfate permease-like transporter
MGVPAIPGVVMLRTYRRAWFSSDLIAGVVLAAILVPQGMAYAELAGLPAVTGLYTTIACLVGYALFGPSTVLVLGPDSSLSPMIFAAITPLLAVSGGGPDTAISRGCSPCWSGRSRSASAWPSWGSSRTCCRRRSRSGT